MTALTIRPITPEDKADWLRLWQGYTDFYHASVPPEVTAHTWARLIDPASPLLGAVAEVAGKVAGFSIAVLHEGTWSAGQVCYLEDLFVDPACRGVGAGRQLIQHLLDQGRAKGWTTLYWHTQSGNPARKLYDEFQSADDFVRYRVKL